MGRFRPGAARFMVESLTRGRKRGVAWWLWVRSEMVEPASQGYMLFCLGKSLVRGKV